MASPGIPRPRGSAAETPPPIGLLDELLCAIAPDQSEHAALDLARAELQARIPGVARTFYEFILSQPTMKQVIEGGGFSIDRLVASFVEWLESVLRQRIDSPMAAERLRVGRLHVHLGVDLRHVLVAFGRVRTALHEHIVEILGVTSAQLPLALRAIDRILDMEICLFTEAYSLERQSLIVDRLDDQRRAIEERLTRVMDSASVLILSFDGEGSITFANHAFEQLSGHAAAGILGSQATKTLSPAGDQEAASAFIARCLARGDEDPEVLPLSTSEGAERWISWYPAAVREGGTEIVEIILLGHDVSERKLRDQQMIHQEKMAAVGLLAAGVAHEIGNPLSSISSVTQTLQRKYQDPMLVEKLGLVRRHIDRISTIVREMVNFARPPRHEWRSCDMNAIVSSAVGIIEFDKRARRVKIVLDLEDDLPATLGIEDQLTQICFNIALNALDALVADPDSEEPRLEITTSRARLPGGGESICVAFTDNGPGVAPEVRSRLFEPFFTTKDVGRGTGLGLSVSYRIAEAHGGRIELEAAAGGGARFVLLVPVVHKAKEAR